MRRDRGGVAAVVLGTALTGMLAAVAWSRATAGSIAPAAPGPASEPQPPARADDGAVVVGEWFRGARTLDLAIRSPVLKEVGRVRLLLPPGWSPSAARTWPTLWLLHGGPPHAGGPSGHAAWTSHTAVERLTADLDVLVVMPDGGRCGDHTDWWNHGLGGPPRWETFHLAELRQILERGYRAGPEGAIAGVSTGGRAALAYAARHPGLFRAAASFSGPLHLLHTDPGRLDGPDLVRLAAEIAWPGADWTRIWGDPVEQRLVWRQHNPYDLAGRLAGVRLYLSAGDGSPVEAVARAGTSALAGKLRKLGIPVTLHLHSDGGRWETWERELRAALPLLVGS
ncbi:alpha/beta hydrolase [Thermomonospora amylolytica]|uniref:alpha/beta hydrolase n=1 Tax=Thermomonospora amylolytica TaxID=1411117 RepID=UPI000E6D4CCF|nr:alpha/beta hydrolase family protein [Thermomonospora amylolytica]